MDDLPLGPVVIVRDRSAFAVRGPKNLIYRLPVREFLYGEIELLADNKINSASFAQRLLRQHRHMWANERYFDFRVRLFYSLGQADVSRESRSAGVEDKKLILLGCIDGFFRGNVMRRGIN